MCVCVRARSAVTNEGDTPANLGASHPALLRSVFGDLTHQATHDPTASTTQPTGASLQQQQGSNGPVMQNQNQNQSGRTSPGLDYDITLSPANSAQLIAEVTAAGAAAAAEVAAGPAPSPLSGAARAVGARSLVPAPPGSAGSAGVTPKNRSLRIRMLAAEDTPGTASASEGTFAHTHKHRHKYRHKHPPTHTHTHCGQCAYATNCKG